VLRRAPRKLIGPAIVLFWLIMIGLLFQREGLVPYLKPAGRSVSARPLRPSDTWMGIYLADGSRIGFVNTNTTPDIREGQVGAALSVTAKLRLSLFSQPAEIFLSGSAWVPQERGVSAFDFQVRSAEHKMRIAATLADGQLDGTIYTGGEVIPLRFSVSKDLLVSGAMGTTTLNVPALEVNEEILIDTFDPMTFSVGKARVKCVGEETIEAAGESVKTKVVTTTLGGVTSKAWIAENDEIVRAETPFGFSLRKLTPQEALSPVEGGVSSDLLRAVAIHPTGLKPFRGAARMRLRFSDIGTDHHPPTDDVQTAAGNEYTITRGTAPGVVDHVEPGFEGDLVSDVFIQASHPKVQEIAGRVVGTETDIWKRAERIYEWVYGNIKKMSVFSIPSALEVLETREGDCNEHTVLCTALGRAAGIPTRIAIGLVWSENPSAFYYHAWPEVRVGGRWIWMDPTLGQAPADATHIKLLNGPIETWPQVLPYIGQLQIDVVSIE
jgi:hypothetical protein